MSEKISVTEPFLKWPGGKRWIASRITTLIRKHLSGTYYEPFLGSGAVFFALNPAKAVLSDVNAELINVYLMVQSQSQILVKRLKKLPVQSEMYYRIRSKRKGSELTRAVRFLYLNRTAFGGMYRLNQRGEFNVPFGGGQRTPAILWKRQLLKQASSALSGVEIMQADFEVVINRAGLGDVIYCDPTYTVAHDNNGFIRYNESNFSWQDQQRLAKVAADAVNRGAMVVVSNAHNRRIAALYPGAKAMRIQRMSCVSTNPSKRRPVYEYLLLLIPSDPACVRK